MLFQIGARELEAMGVAPASATALAQRLRALAAGTDPRACWRALSRDLLEPEHPFALHLWLYLRLAEGDSPGSAPFPAWYPDARDLARANLTQLMAHTGHIDYADFHNWSVTQREAFWELMIQTLGIRMREPYMRVLDNSAGWENPRWLIGGRLNIADSCFAAAPSAPAIIFRRAADSPLETLGYGELDALSNRVANGLAAMGLGVGDGIAIDMPMTVESVAIYLGIVKAGAIVISIADSFSPAEIETRLRIGRARAIFTSQFSIRDGRCLPMYEKVQAANAPRAIVLPVGGEAGLELRPGDLIWDDFLCADDRFEAVAMDPAAHINILFSSGTTGDPKAIPWNHTTPIKCAVDGLLHQDIHAGDRVAWPTNLGWMMGPWLIFASLINRATIALYQDSPGTRGFCRFVADAGVTILGVVPSLVSAWRRTAAIEGLDWRGLAGFSSTGECSNPTDMLYLMSRAGYRPVIEYCGGTEIGGGYITGTFVQPAAPATFTTPAVGLALVILDEGGEPADQGEVFLVPPSIGLSTELINADHHAVYYEDLPVDPGGRHLRRHGDQLERLPGGFLRALGRADDTMNLGGIKTSSAEIERAMLDIEGVRETAAIAVAPPGGGPSQLVIVAAVENPARVDREAMHAAMQAAIRARLNPLFKIHALQLVTDLPRTASGKVMRRILRRRFNQDGSGV